MIGHLDLSYELSETDIFLSMKLSKNLIFYIKNSIFSSILQAILLKNIRLGYLIFASFRSRYLSIKFGEEITKNTPLHVT